MDRTPFRASQIIAKATVIGILGSCTAPRFLYRPYREGELTHVRRDKKRGRHAIPHQRNGTFKSPTVNTALYGEALSVGVTPRWPPMHAVCRTGGDRCQSPRGSGARGEMSSWGQQMRWTRGHWHQKDQFKSTPAVNG